MSGKGGQGRVRYPELMRYCAVFSLIRFDESSDIVLIRLCGLQV